jgi:hypothetical protein
MAQFGLQKKTLSVPPPTPPRGSGNVSHRASRPPGKGR